MTILGSYQKRIINNEHNRKNDKRDYYRLLWRDGNGNWGDRIMNKKQAQAITHTLSNTSKMPGKSYSIPAQFCNTGGKLQKVKGSVCNDCYALKGMYRFNVVKNALLDRLASLDHPQWSEAMIVQVKGQEYFRWHDSGDLQTIGHLIKIVEVCNATPSTMHWLPTKEKEIIKRYIRIGGVIPDNLLIRYSLPMVDSTANAFFKSDRIKSSRVLTKEKAEQVRDSQFICPAPKQGNQCGKCRACWLPTFSDIAYLKH